MAEARIRDRWLHYTNSTRQRRGPFKRSPIYRDSRGQRGRGQAGGAERDPERGGGATMSSRRGEDDREGKEREA